MAGRRFSSPGSATFEPRERAARTARNPSTGAQLELAPTRAVGFEVGATFKQQVADSLTTAATKKESGTNWGRSRGQCLPICGVGEAGIPAVEVRGQFVVEDAGADLEEQVGSTRSPAHLLLLHHAFADDLVDGGLDEGAGDGLPGAVAIPVVGDPVGVGPEATGPRGRPEYAMFRKTRKTSPRK